MTENELHHPNMVPREEWHEDEEERDGHHAGVV